MDETITNCVLFPLVENDGMNPVKAFNKEFYIDKEYTSAYYRDSEGVAHKLIGELPIPEIGYFNFYVSPSGNDLTGDGSPNNPFRTIFRTQNHIRQNKYPNASHYNINLANGIYNNNIILNMPKDIRVIGNIQNPNLVVLSHSLYDKIISSL